MSNLRERWEHLVAALPAEDRRRIAGHVVVHLPADVPPWTAVGLDVAAGEEVTLLADGEIVLSKELDLRGLASFHLWARTGGRGPIRNGTRATTTFRAPNAGPLELAVYQGEWATPDGTLATPPEAYQGLEGGFDVVAIRWAGEARPGLEALARARPDPLVGAELERLKAGAREPEGWRHLWFLGPTEIFSTRPAGEGGGIHVRTHRDAGILQKRVEFDLTPSTRVSWSWRVSELPSRVAEDSPITHDYLSIAFEFENGRDLTYYWSAELPPETSYACPLPTWNPRETHLVVRSGQAGLGEWHAESRSLLEDVRRAMGDSPSKVVAVWLIAVTIFRRGTGEADFRDIRITDGERTLAVA